MFGLKLVSESELRELKAVRDEHIDKAIIKNFELKRVRKENEELEKRIKNRDEFIENLSNENEELKKYSWIHNLSSEELKQVICSVHSRAILKKKDIFESIEIAKAKILGGK